MEDLERKQRVVRTATRVAAAGVFLLLIAGALVTSTESGLAVPDWPLSYGKLMPPMVGGIRFEHGHRLPAAARLAAGAVLLQIFLGAVMRHTAAGLAVPDFPLSFGRLFPTAAELARPGVAIHLAHRFGAVLVTVLVARAAARLVRVAHVSRVFE